jgi:DNA repair protein RadA
VHISSRLKEVAMEEIPEITSDMIEKLKKLNINSVYQLVVQSPFELARDYEDTSLNVESASKLIPPPDGHKIICRD